MHKDLFQLFLISPVKGMAGTSGKKEWGKRSNNQHTPRESVIGKRQDKYSRAKEHRTVSFYYAITVIPCLLEINRNDRAIDRD